MDKPPADLREPPPGFTAMGKAAWTAIHAIADRDPSNKAVADVSLLALAHIMQTETMLLVIHGLVNTPLSSPAYADRVREAKGIIDNVVKSDKRFGELLRNAMKADAEVRSGGR